MHRGRIGYSDVCNTFPRVSSAAYTVYGFSVTAEIFLRHRLWVCGRMLIFRSDKKRGYMRERKREFKSIDFEVLARSCRLRNHQVALSRPSSAVGAIWQDTANSDSTSKVSYSSARLPIEKTSPPTTSAPSSTAPERFRLRAAAPWASLFS
ncbi:hypothetical protein F2P81_008211 [Scophthalmus maximus]|uniref:Uncharacterized protein n=1 Tax=Scophthalmus maximus TaxID=52904 RepID=A0A6A4SXL9_SCOMX|nr:hypothetical protein F2P81_008211 [Scophthalmus maximus]